MQTQVEKEVELKRQDSPFSEQDVIVNEPIMRFFEWRHLPPGLQIISKPFGHLACDIYRILPRNAERTTALRKLLEAKDCAVRAAL